MKGTILLILSVVALAITIYWAYTNDGNIEPYSASASALLTMLTVYFSLKEKTKNTEIKGIDQSNNYSGGNEQEIEGDFENVKQSNWFSFQNKQNVKK